MAIPMSPSLLYILSMFVAIGVLVIVAGQEVSTRTKFKAAVFGHAVKIPPNSTQVVSRSLALEYMRVNLEEYRTQAREAKSQGADILVFPEDGIYGYKFTRDSVYPYLEYVPDPDVTQWSPCQSPDLYADSEVQKELSCMAMENSMYIVANMGDKQPCNIALDPKCPPDGRYQYNTNVAYGPDGTLLAKYHKFHLFYEDQFDTPASKIVSFDTPFGTFGMLICFDVLFYDPGLPMILKNHISNIVFPTAWMDALPLLSALGFHSSFARALGVNMLSANIHLPEYRFHGSGVYTPEGAKIFYYGTSSESPPRLLVTELDVLKKPKPNINTTSLVQVNDNQLSLPTDCSNTTSKDFSYLLEGKEFHSLLFFDNFTFKTLDEAEGSLKLCQKSVCCVLHYSISRDDFGRELFAFGAFDGLHTYEGQYYFQICALVKCADAANKSSCGAATYTSTTSFTRVEILGQMRTQYIYPQILLSNDSGELELAEPESWGFHNSFLWTNTTFKERLLSAALYGRHYSHDNCSSVASWRADIWYSPSYTSLHKFFIYSILAVMFSQNLI